MPPKTTQATASINVRMPATLRDWLAEEAARNHRSLNGEIVALLDAAHEDAPLVLTDEERVQDDTFAARYGDYIRGQIDKMLTERLPPVAP